MAYISEWFKILKDGELIGAVTNQSFARYSEKSGRVHVCDASEGQLVICREQYYRDDWMLPVPKDAKVEYENATVLSIDEKEYDILNGYEWTEPIDVDDLINTDIPDEVEKKRTEAEEATIEYVRKCKLNELSVECEQIIENGFDLTLTDGVSHHFSMRMRDQINLMALQQALADGNDMIYHADGELEQFYSAEDTRLILSGAQKWKSYHVALFNSLKNWIIHLEDISEIDAVTFDSEIPEEYCTQVLLSLTENF